MRRIRFALRSDRPNGMFLSPQPGSQFVPQWYRDGEKWINKNDGSLEIPEVEDRAAGMKSCVPFLDAIISGYIYPLSYSIEILKNNGTDPIEYRYVEKNENGEYVDIGDVYLMDERDGMIGHTIPRPFGCSDNHLVWTPLWGTKTPKGWSCLLTHPLNRFDLPFVTMSGIMESDRFTGAGNVPFFIKKDFIGIIEKGTPLFQVIPIKRAKWFGYVKIKKDSISQLISNKARENSVGGYYRDKMWEKKVYEME